MKFSVLALDYDGTIAVDGRLDVGVAAVLAEVRDRGIAVVVVSGRTLADLREVSGGLDWADAFVLEDGAVVTFPGGDTRLLAREASPPLMRAMREEGVPFTAGQCVIEASADDAARILALVRSLELPLALHFNRGRLMVLPYGISKETGLREVLRAFRLSSHNTLAIGDAENDHPLLQASEVGAAVAWGSKALLADADDVVPGSGPPAVAHYLRRALESMRLPPARRVRHRVALGRSGDGTAVKLGVRNRNVLVAGDPRSGKSWAIGLICEQLIVAGYSLCIVDPEGDYGPLEALPGVVVVGGPHALPDPREITRSVHHPDLSVVIDLSRSSHDRKIDYLRGLLPALKRFRRVTGLPHRIVIDEAHYFLDRSDAEDFVDFELGGYALVTYRVSNLTPAVLATTDAVIMTHTSDPREIETLARVAGKPDGELSALLGDLAIDEAALVRTSLASEADAERFRLAPRLTEHVRHRAKYVDVPLPAEHAFVFTRASRPYGAGARTLRAFTLAIEQAPHDVIAGHARRGDFSRWIGDVLGDQPLATTLSELEAAARRGDALDLRTALVNAISARYAVARETER
jgi:hydroxymethylpyrimidine pyrophosphatase-like HAD family hydrolase